MADYEWDSVKCYNKRDFPSTAQLDGYIDLVLNNYYVAVQDCVNMVTTLLSFIDHAISMHLKVHTPDLKVYS